MTWETVAHIMGGLGLFLIGTEIITLGFKEAAGNSLRRILSEHTQTTVKGLFAGFFVASATQSATAVILTLIGFVNANILKLRQAVNIVLGSNLGKITTVCIIATLGLNIDLSAYALPTIGVGVILRGLLKKQHKGYGNAIIGFALMFLGIGFLKSSVAGMTGIFTLAEQGMNGFYNNSLCLLFGVIITIIAQSIITNLLERRIVLPAFSKTSGIAGLRSLTANARQTSIAWPSFSEGTGLCKRNRRE